MFSESVRKYAAPFYFSRSKARSACFRSILTEGIEGGREIVCLIVTSDPLPLASLGSERKELEEALELKESCGTCLWGSGASP